MHTTISSECKLYKSGKWFKTINFTWLVIQRQRQRGAVVLELASRVEGGQGVILTLDVAIFVFTGNFLLFSFLFFVHIFPFGLFPFIPTADPL